MIDKRSDPKLFPVVELGAMGYFKINIKELNSLPCISITLEQNVSDETPGMVNVTANFRAVMDDPK